MSSFGLDRSFCIFAVGDRIDIVLFARILVVDVLLIAVVLSVRVALARPAIWGGIIIVLFVRILVVAIHGLPA